MPSSVIRARKLGMKAVDERRTSWSSVRKKTKFGDAAAVAVTSCSAPQRSHFDIEIEGAMTNPDVKGFAQINQQMNVSACFLFACSYRSIVPLVL